MKGKLWELGPFVLAILIGLYVVVARLRETPATPRRASAGTGDPTKPEDFLPDPESRPDPNSVPDPRQAR